ncbi:MAG: nucleoside triphosphate pyrophosphohydrolase family protein [Actinobacteria bacterium]|nr:nucleoside triphosphate pyrophosphohydrolase family protein [Actinomycetota bacterium]
MKLNQYQDEARATAIYPDEHAVIYPTLGLNGEAGEVADKVKKTIRDTEDGIYDIDDLEKELGDVLWYLANLACDLGLSLEQIAQTNIDKLNSRKDRGVLGGSGDDR